MPFKVECFYWQSAFRREAHHLRIRQCRHLHPIHRAPGIWPLADSNRGCCVMKVQRSSLLPRIGWLHVPAWARPLIVAWLLWSAIGSVSAQTYYDTSRIIPPTKNECIGQNAGDCIRVRSREITVDVGSAALIALSCPSTHPHVVGWHARHHEHVSMHALKFRPPRPRGVGFTPGTLRVTARNNAASSIVSASSFFSRRFSSSNAFSLRASETSIPP